jgi:hypothetical protein|tara:strand:+ start:87 stop:272 length:186 start_codon:yes stop_codon:yes gene_type:complete
MKTGVNKNGVRWIQEGNVTTCIYQLTSSVELMKSFENINQRQINAITGTQLLNEQKEVKKK